MAPAAPQRARLPLTKATIVFCDNVSACYMSSNPVHHKCTKHIELDVHFVREKDAVGQCQVLQVPTTQQLADVMTKGLPTASFREFRDSLCVASNDAHTTGGVRKQFYTPCGSPSM
jgi:cytolysin (calcineurin-like family phosphatase)